MISYNNEVFRKSILEKEVKGDLELAIKLNKIPLEKRTEEQKKLTSFLKNKYKPDGDCPSKLFPYISENLKEEYSHLHNHIVDVLY